MMCFRKSQDNQKELKLLLDMYKSAPKEQRDKVQVNSVTFTIFTPLFTIHASIYTPHGYSRNYASLKYQGFIVLNQAQR